MFPVSLWLELIIRPSRSSGLAALWGFLQAKGDLSCSAAFWHPPLSAVRLQLPLRPSLWWSLVFSLIAKWILHQDETTVLYCPFCNVSRVNNFRRNSLQKNKTLKAYWPLKKQTTLHNESFCLDKDFYIGGGGVYCYFVGYKTNILIIHNWAIGKNLAHKDSQKLYFKTAKYWIRYFPPLLSFFTLVKVRWLPKK